MTDLRHIFIFARKDLKLFIADRGAIFFFLLFPLLFITMFSLMSFEAQDTRLQLNLVTKEDAGGLSQQIMQSMATPEDAQLPPGEPLIVILEDYESALRMVDDKEISGFLAFPADFTSGVFMGYGTELEVVADAEAVYQRAALNGLARAVASRVGFQQVAINATIGLLAEQGMAGGDTSGIEQVIRQYFQDQTNVIAQDSLVLFDTQYLGDIEPENPSNWAIPGYLVMFVFFAGGLAAESIVRERQNHTLERLLASSVKRPVILGGMFAGSAAKGLVQITIFWLVGILAFNTDMGSSPLAVIVLSVLMVIMSAAFGIMLATLVKTQRSAGSMAVLAALVLAPLGGCWWPLFILPRWMQALAKITPHGWANAGFNKLMLFGADFGAVVPEMLVLAGFTLLFGLIAVWRFRTSST